MGVLMKNKRNYSAGNILMTPECYSTEEREIGAWTDGKPLYQKTVNIGKITQTGERIYTIGIQNVDTIVAYSLLPLERQGDTGLYAIDNYNNSWGSGSYTAYTFKKDSTAGLQIIIYSGYYKSINDIYATVQYTKTTDTPGSGIWTPQGVPSEHYSTEERVVGTWIDGSTVYEKVIEFNPTFSITTSFVSCGVDSTAMDKILYTSAINPDGTGYGDIMADPTMSNHTLLGLKASTQHTVECIIIRYTKTSS